MFLKLLRAKIHRATVTQAEIDYVGSITIDEDLMDQAGLLHWEDALIADLTNGERFHTYVIPGPRGSGMVCINGAAAKLVRVGDRIIIMAFAFLTPDEVKTHRPRVALVDDRNQFIRML